MGTVTITNPTADAEIGDMTSIIIDAQPDPGETPDQVRLTIEKTSSPEHSTHPLVGAWGAFTNQISRSPPGTGFTHRPQQHRITVEVQFRKNYPPPPSTSTASASVLVWVITTIVRDVNPEYLLWNPDVGQPLQITWTLEHAAPISSPPLRKRVRIFDLSGQRVRSLYYNPQVDPDNEFTDTAPGSQVEVWDGRGDPDPVTGEQQVLPRGVYSFEIFAEHLFDSESHKNTAQYLTVDDVRLCLTGSTGTQTNMEVSCLLSEPGAAPPRQPSKMRALLFNWDLTKLDEKAISNPPLSPTRAVVTTLVASLSDPRPYFVAVIAEDGRRDEDRMHRYYRPAIMKGLKDEWLSLRDVCRRHTKGDTFALTLLNQSIRQQQGFSNPTLFGSPGSAGGGGTFLSDCPEHLADAGTNDILWADVTGLEPGVRYRFYVHHENNTTANRRIRLMGVNAGSEAAVVRVGPVDLVASSWDPTPAKAGQNAVRSYLSATRFAVTEPADHDVKAQGQTTDVTLPSVPQPPDLPQARQIYNFGDVPPNRTLSTIGELEVLEGPTAAIVRVYVVVGTLNDADYQPDGPRATCSPTPTGQRHRGTFPQRLVERSGGPFSIVTGVETPWMTELVDATDRGWQGTDKTSSTSQPTAHNEGNWGRMHYLEFELRNDSAEPMNVAVVSQMPRAGTGAGQKALTAIRDVGGGVVYSVPKDGMAAIDDPKWGTVVWKGRLSPNAAPTKRYRYTPAAGGTVVMDVWIVVWGGDSGPGADLAQ